MKESKSPVAGEPVEPTGEELLRSSLDSVETDFDEDCLRIFREGRSFERLTRERKRGERPANPYPAHGIGLASHDEVWERAAAETEAWCNSGDSDERAALRAELAEVIEQRATLHAHVAQCCEALELNTTEHVCDTWGLHARCKEVIAERDAEKARADRAEAKLVNLGTNSGQWHELALSDSALTQAKARIAELEAELVGEQDDNVALRARIGRLAGLVERLSAEKERADGAEASRDIEQECHRETDRRLTRELQSALSERDGWRAQCATQTERADALTRELAAANARGDGWRDRFEADTAELNRLSGELAEAREELLRAKDALHWLVNGGDDIYPVEIDQHEINWHDYNEGSGISVDHDNTPDGIMTALVDAFCARGADTVERMANYREQLDAHRAKPSPQSPSSEELSRTAKLFAKAVRYYASADDLGSNPSRALGHIEHECKKLRLTLRTQRVRAEIRAERVGSKS